MVAANEEIQLPQELAETARRLAIVAEHYLPQFLSRGLERAQLPAIIRPLIRPMLADTERLKLLLPAMLLTHPTQERFLTPPEAREFFRELVDAAKWALAEVVNGENPHE